MSKYLLEPNKHNDHKRYYDYDVIIGNNRSGIHRKQVCVVWESCHLINGFYNIKKNGRIFIIKLTCFFCRVCMVCTVRLCRRAHYVNSFRFLNLSSGSDFACSLFDNNAMVSGYILNRLPLVRGWRWQLSISIRINEFSEKCPQEKIFEMSKWLFEHRHSWKWIFFRNELNFKGRSKSNEAGKIHNNFNGTQ